MLSKEEIQEWIDGENKGRTKSPNVYQGKYLIISDGWLDGLHFAQTHKEEDVKKEYLCYVTKNLDEDFYGHGYFKALEMVLGK